MQRAFDSRINHSLSSVKEWLWPGERPPGAHLSRRASRWLLALLTLPPCAGGNKAVMGKADPMIQPSPFWSAWISFLSLQISPPRRGADARSAAGGRCSAANQKSPANREKEPLRSSFYFVLIIIETTKAFYCNKKAAVVRFNCLHQTIHGAFIRLHGEGRKDNILL